MARIYTEGGEMGDILFWDGYVGTVEAVTADPAPPHSEYCYKLSGFYTSCYKNLPSNLSEIFIRQRVYFDSFLAGTGWRIPAFRNSATQVLYLGLNASHYMVAYSEGGTTLATSTYALSTGQWYLMEIYVKLADAPNGRFSVYVDGTNRIDFTGDTKTGANTEFDNVFWACAQSLGSVDEFSIDDIAMNDTTGGSDNSWCGDGVIVKITPNGNGTTNNWHGSDGDDTNNYLLVDEYPLDDEVTYVYHDATASGTQDQYAMSDDFSGTNRTILRVYPEARLRKTASSIHTVKLGILASGGSDEMSGDISLSTSYNRYVGDEYTVNPVDSQPWEEADIDALEFVVEVG